MPVAVIPPLKGFDLTLKRAEVCRDARLYIQVRKRGRNGGLTIGFCLWCDFCDEGAPVGKQRAWKVRDVLNGNPDVT